MKNLFKLFYYYIVFKSFFKSEEERIKEEILYKQRGIDKIKQYLKYDLYQSELDDLLKIKEKNYTILKKEKLTLLKSKHLK